MRLFEQDRDLLVSFLEENIDAWYSHCAGQGADKDSADTIISELIEDNEV